MCNAHYLRFLKHGDPLAHIPIRDRGSAPKTCLTGCGRTVLARGYCATHYQRLRTNGDVGPTALIRRPADAEATEKVCTKCGELKPVEDFYTSKRNRDGRIEQCKSCFALKQTNYARKRKYGISSSDFEVLSTAQGGRCAMCDDATKLVIDHCHRSGEVRELLCDRCNRLLGVADDSVELLEKAIAYIKRHI